MGFCNKLPNELKIMKRKKEYIGNSRAFSIILKVLGVLILLLSIVCFIKSCAYCSYQAKVADKTGYLPDFDDLDNIPDVIPPYSDEDTVDLFDKVSLEEFFPPIGDQGDKGTCVAWAVGYNLKTALNAIDNKWDSVMLAQPENQTSPKDLWFSIPQQQKGSACSGTGFESAFATLMTTGAASMADVPYLDLQDCSGVGIGDSTNCIEGYYEVSREGKLPSLAQIKCYLADSIPLVVGARLGDRFMQWKGDRVINYDSYNRTSMHAYHAMVLVGFDDSRRAFRLRNSWGTEWGDRGSIWVDYDFFYRHMCYVVLMANNKQNK